MPTCTHSHTSFCRASHHATLTTFSHPDYTVGSGFSPDLPHPFPEIPTM